MTGAGIELAPLITKMKVDINGFKSDMEKVKTEALAQAKRIQTSMDKTVKVGQSMSKVGSTLTKTLTVPIAGAGVAITKMAMDYETSFAKVSTLLDKNVVDYDKYKNDILDASSDTKTAVDEYSDAVYQSISAGVDQRKAIGFTTEAIKLAKGGFTTGASAVDIMTTAINGYNMKTEDATKISDMLITTQNLGKTTVDELSASMGKVIPVANSVNFGMDELSASYAQLTKNGIATAEAGTYLKSMLSELGKSGSIADKTLRELTGKGFAELKKEGRSTSDILKLLDDNAQKNDKSLKDMFGSVEAGTAAMVLLKGEGKEYDEMLKAMQGSAGATQEAFDKMDSTPAEKLKGALNELKNAGIKLGAQLVPIVTKFAEKLSDLVDKFNKLTPAQQESIIKMGGLAIAAGPVLKITGSLVSGFGKLAPAIGKASTMVSKGIPLLGKLGTGLAESGGMVGKVGGLLAKLVPTATTAGSALTTTAAGAATASAGVAGAATASGGLLASLGGMAVAAAPWVAGAAAIGAAGYGIYKTLNEDVIPEVDLFKDEVTTAYDSVTGAVSTSTVKVSEETQKQVQSYLDLSNQAQQESMNMYAGITAITDENIASLTTKVNDMSNQIISTTNTQKTSVVAEYQDLFSQTDQLTTSEQSEILATVQKGYDDRIEKTKSLKNELIGIYDQIRKQGGEITKDQQERIDQIYDEMKEQAVQAMSDNEAEQNVILNRLSSGNKRVTAEMVGDTIKQMNEAKDKQIAVAAEKRDKLVMEAEKLKTLEGGKYADKAKKIIDAANKEYEGIADNAEKAKEKGVDKLMEAHSDLADEIDRDSGEIKSTWDKIGDWWSNLFKGSESKKVEIETVHKDTYVSSNKKDGSHYNGLSYVPFDGYTARLHKGERVLTAKENKQYIQGGKSDSGSITINTPILIDGRELAHVQAEYTLEELGFSF